MSHLTLSFSRKKPIILALLLCASAVLAVAARAWFIASPASPAQQPSERVEVELITVRSTGFDPKEVTRPQGRFILEVDNRAGLAEVDLRLDPLGRAGSRSGNSPSGLP